MSTDTATEKTTITEAEALLAQRHPRMGHYGYSVLRGSALLSGADLQGKASEYGSSYYETRQKVIAIVEECGGHIRKGPHGKLTIEWADLPEGAEYSVCALGDCWKY